MRDHSGCKRAYVRHSKAWYAKTYEEVSISIGMYHPYGGTSGEFMIVWDQIDRYAIPQLRAYDDSWSALLKFNDLLEKMGEIDDKNVSESEFCMILNELNIIDITDYERGNETNKLK